MARKNDDMSLQTRAIVRDYNGERMAFVKHDNGLFVLPGDVQSGTEVISGKEHIVFKPRFTTLEKIKLWSKINKYTVEVDDTYPVYYSVSESMKHCGVSR